MKRDKNLNIRISAEDAQNLALISEAMKRTISDCIRVLIRSKAKAIRDARGLQAGRDVSEG